MLMAGEEVKAIAIENVKLRTAFSNQCCLEEFAWINKHVLVAMLQLCMQFYTELLHALSCMVYAVQYVPMQLCQAAFILLLHIIVHMSHGSHG